MLDIAAALLDACADSLPRAVVVRVGLASNADRGDEHWALVEANMAWFSTCYAADPGPVLDVVLRSAEPRQRLTPGEQTLTRPPTPSGKRSTATDMDALRENVNVDASMRAHRQDRA